MKPLHLALGLGGAFLLFGKKKDRVGPSKAKDSNDVDSASAIATAQAAQDAIGAGTGSGELQLQAEKAELEAQEEYLAPPATVQGVNFVFGPTHHPTPYEFACLYSMNPLLAARAVPDNALRGQLSQQVANNSVLSHIATRPLSDAQKMALGVQLMSPQQTRLFAADCLEMALPVFEQAFPGSASAGSRLVGTIRNFSNSSPAARSRARQEMEKAVLAVIKVCEQKPDNKAVIAFMRAAILSSVTKENFGPMVETSPKYVKDAMLRALRDVKDLAIESRKLSAASQEAKAFRGEVGPRPGGAARGKIELSRNARAVEEAAQLSQMMEARIANAQKVVVKDAERGLLQRSMKGLLR